MELNNHNCFILGAGLSVSNTYQNDDQIPKNYRSFTILNVLVNTKPISLRMVVTPFHYHTGVGIIPVITHRYQHQISDTTPELYHMYHNRTRTTARIPYQYKCQR